MARPCGFNPRLAKVKPFAGSVLRTRATHSIEALVHTGAAP
jgi:hypothetical protein